MTHLTIGWLSHLWKSYQKSVRFSLQKKLLEQIRLYYDETVLGGLGPLSENRIKLRLSFNDKNSNLVRPNTTITIRQTI